MNDEPMPDLSFKKAEALPGVAGKILTVRRILDLVDWRLRNPTAPLPPNPKGLLAYEREQEERVVEFKAKPPTELKKLQTWLTGWTFPKTKG